MNQKKLKLKLFDAIKRNDIKDVEQFILQGANIEAKDENGDTPLIFAISQGNAEIVEYLVKNSANIEAVDENGNTPLMIAIKYSSAEIAVIVEIIEYLIKNGANIEAEDENGYTPLMFAISGDYENIEIVKILTINGALFNFGVPQLNPEIENVMEAAALVTLLFTEGSVIDHEEIENFDPDIFLSRYKHCLSVKGYVIPYQQHIDNLNKYYPKSSKVKDALIKSIRQDQDDFNMECASLFSRIPNSNNLTPIPLNDLIGQFKDSIIDENVKTEFPAIMQQLFKFYNNNSSLTLSDIKDFLTNSNSTDEEANAFKAKVTAANIEILQNNIATIVDEKYIEQLQYLVTMGIPSELQQLINNVLTQYDNSIDDSDEAVPMLLDNSVDTQALGDDEDLTSGF